MYVDFSKDLNKELNTENPYFSFSSYVKRKYGVKVGKISIDTNFGCIHKEHNLGGCIFCNLNMYRPKYVLQDEILKYWEEGLTGYKSRYEKFYAYFQLGTPLSENVCLESIAIAEKLLEFDTCVGVMFSARSDFLHKYILEKLNTLSGNKNKEIWLEIGIQSSSNKTLRYINRGHTFENYKEKIIEIDREYQNLLVCSHIIFGLPEEDGVIESEETMLKTVSDVCSLPIAAVKYHHLQVVVSTRLSEIYENHSFKTLTKEYYALLVARAVSLTNKNIIISRLAGNSKADGIIAPKWGVNKGYVVSLINKVIKEKSVIQGCDRVWEF